MILRIVDSHGRKWEATGEWIGAMVGADYEGRGKILAWLSPVSDDAGLTPEGPGVEEIMQQEGAREALEEVYIDVEVIEELPPVKVKELKHGEDH